MGRRTKSGKTTATNHTLVALKAWGMETYMTYTPHGSVGPIGWIYRVKATDKFSVWFCDGHQQIEAKADTLDQAVAWLKAQHK